MGCHTWFLTKSDRSYEQAKDNYLLRSRSAVDFVKKTDNENRKTGKIGKTGKIDILLRQIRMVEGGFCKVAVWNRQTDGIYLPQKGFYKYCDDFHDVFRVGGYPDVCLFSLTETLIYIEKYEKERGFSIIDSNEIERLNNFWQKYPDGMIKFG